MQITDTEFGQIFPFFFHLDTGGHMTEMGPSLRRYLEYTEQPLTLLDQFIFESPKISRVDQIHQHLDRVILMVLRAEPGLVLRGQFLRLSDSSGFLFFGIPWVTDLKSLSEIGLSLRDYSLYEPTTYFLMLTEAQRNSLEESANIQQQLKEVNESLSKRVERRTERLSEINSELIASQEKLREEMKQREEMEIELRLAHKLEALGQLSAGIAHEINTPIQFIGDSLTFLQEATYDMRAATLKLVELIDIKNPEIKEKLLSINRNYDLDFLIGRVPESIDRAINGVQRVSTIVKSMKAFTHHDMREKSFADINTGIENTLVVSRNEYKMIAEIETHLGKLPEFYCNIGDLNQVFLNLILNSTQAIEEKFKATSPATMGKIVITTKKLKDQIFIAISDNGCGIPKTIIERIFDPFFTTKAIGKGSGQGLSLCHRIVVNRHAGKIKVTSEPGVGTEFKIYLPITDPVECSEEQPHE